MADIAPDLARRIKDMVAQAEQSDEAMAAIYDQIASGGATYAQAYELAELVGGHMSDALMTVLTPDALPNGRLYYNIADKTVRPALENGYGQITRAAADIQTSLNAAAGFGIKGVAPNTPTQRIHGIVQRLSDAEDFEAITGLLDEPVRTLSLSAVDETIRENVELHARAGLNPRIIRIAESGCCEWCASLAGAYDYPAPQDVYRRHNRCRCRTVYDPADGTQLRQNVWSKRWVDPEEAEKIAVRKYVNTEPRLPPDALDATQAYRKSARPRQGAIEYEEGYREEFHSEEVKFSQWVHNTMGGDLKLLKEVDKEGQYTADFLWYGKLWDLKSITTEKAANSALRHGLKQIRSNPGGIFLDIQKTNYDLQGLYDVIGKRMQWHKDLRVDIAIVSQGKLVQVLRF